MLFPAFDEDNQAVGSDIEFLEGDDEDTPRQEVPLHVNLVHDKHVTAQKINKARRKKTVTIRPMSQSELNVYIGNLLRYEVDEQVDCELSFAIQNPQVKKATTPNLTMRMIEKALDTVENLMPHIAWDREVKHTGSVVLKFRKPDKCPC